MFQKNKTQRQHSKHARRRYSADAVTVSVTPLPRNRERLGELRTERKSILAALFAMNAQTVVKTENVAVITQRNTYANSRSTVKIVCTPGRSTDYRAVSSPESRASVQYTPTKCNVKKPSKVMFYSDGQDDDVRHTPCSSTRVTAPILKPAKEPNVHEPVDYKSKFIKLERLANLPSWM